MDETAWEERISAAWESFDQVSEADFLALIEKLAAELPPDSGIGFFERASSLDATDHPDVAVPLYRQALEHGLEGGRRRRAIIQMASSLRNIGRPEESVALLTAEIDAGSDELDGAVLAFLALALADTGREREGISAALAALAPHLPRYQRSVATYARLLVEPETDS
ncbi:MAG: tetratricopeptide repeat protein [Streptosporangiaceae bacterium]|jgi:tetratricopeptide (TPR) repeat protein